jgi:flagellar motor switch protein FliM
MLEVVFDRMVRLMTTSLRNFTSDNVDVSIESMFSARFGDYVDSVPLPAMLSVFKAYEWDNSAALMVVDSSLIYSIVDVLLGGRRGKAFKIEGRPYTTIERNLVERLVQVIIGDLQTSFEPLTPVHFNFERLETNPRFATIVRPNNVAIIAKLRIEMEDRGGIVDIVLPYATLEPVRDILLQMFLGEKFGRDAIWENHLAGELLETEIEIEALLDQVMVPLSKIRSWEVGSQLVLSATPHTKITLACGEKRLYMGRVGRKNGAVSIQIEESLIENNKQE